MNDYRYPFFHWATGLALCSFAMGGFIVGLLVGLAL